VKKKNLAKFKPRWKTLTPEENKISITRWKTKKITYPAGNQLNLGLPQGKS